MREKKRLIGMITSGVLLVLLASFWMGATTPASAQCGSQASSCKNCHEVQGEYPVNNDGTSWHQSHAFGDFCAVCHAGNSQATDKDAAHTGLEDPLADIKASCQQCHVDDLEERAQVYASALGVDLNAGGSSSSGGGSAASSGGGEAAPSNTGSAAVVAAPPASAEVVVDDPNVVDYVQRYNEVVLGKKPINKGNAVLVVLIVLLIVGGGGYVLYNEHWIEITTEPLAPVPEGYPVDVVEVLPKLKQLSKKARRGLKKLVEKPDAADELLDAVARIAEEEEGGE